MAQNSMFSGGIGIPDGAFKRLNTDDAEEALRFLISNITTLENIVEGGAPMTFVELLDDTQSATVVGNDIELTADSAGEKAFVIWSQVDGKKIYLSYTDVVDDIGGNTDPATGARNQNLLRNGAFNWWRWATSKSALGTSTAICADAWCHRMLGSVTYTASQSTDVPTQAQASVVFNYSLKLDITGADASVDAGDFGWLRTTIEGYDFAVAAQRDCTFSFWVKSVKTGTFCVAFTNSGRDRVLVKEYTINAANTWEHKEVVMLASPSGGTWNYLNGVGLEIYLTLFCGATAQTTADTWNTVAGLRLATSNQVNFGDDAANNIFFTGLQFQEGNTSSEFEHVPVAEDMLRMQRYYNKSFELETQAAANVGFGGAYTATQTVAASTAQPHVVDVHYPALMRETPTVGLYNPSGPGGGDQVRNVTTGANCTSSSVNASTALGFYITATTPGGSAVGDLLSVHYDADAEFLDV